MTAVFKPPSKKRALLVAIRHVQRKTGSKFSNLANLDLAHRDAKALRDTLIASHGYQIDDITLMIDDRCHPEHLWPTHDKILHQIDRLTRNAPEDCHFFFYFSGHGLEEDVLGRASMRADGQDDEIVCADAKPILDYILHDRLVTPLKNVKGSKLFVLFDCCHSETLLDLQRGNAPNSYSRAWKLGPGQRFKDISTAFARLKLNKNRSNVPPPPRRSSTKWRSAPTSKTEEVGELSVICLSPCRDGESAHDDCKRELTFTKCFLDTMAAKPNITWTDLRDALQELVSEIRARYEETYLQDPSSESDISHGHWTQKPRYSTTSHTDLTRIVSF